MSQLISRHQNEKLCWNIKKPAQRISAGELIKEAILRVEPVANARIVKHDRLTIK